MCSSELDPLQRKSDDEKPDQPRPLTPLEKFRMECGVPENLREEPVIIITAKPAVFDRGVPQHRAFFQYLLDHPEEEDKIPDLVTYIPIKNINPEDLGNNIKQALKDLVRLMIIYDAYANNGELPRLADGNLLTNDELRGLIIPEQPKSRLTVPLPQLLINAIVTPPLDKNGRSTDIGYTLGTYGPPDEVIMKIIRFLRESGIPLLESGENGLLDDP